MSILTRRNCLVGSTGALAWLGISAPTLAAGLVADRSGAGSPEYATDQPPANFPSQPPQLVREMVGASHGNVDRVTALLKERPQLANAAWDWGFGDWETALGAASHVGNRAIAAMLMDHGARPDLFTFAMLGNVDAVRAAIAATPGIERWRGPHGITLASHARAGGEPSAPVVSYLATLPGADVPYPGVALDAESRGIYLGDYRYGSGTDEVIEVRFQEKQATLSLGRVGGAWRALTYMGSHAFHPAGAPDVRVHFKIENDQAIGLGIAAPAPLVDAHRI
jgi:hypothetical protein